MAAPIPKQVVELIATGPDSGQTWRQQLVEGQVVRVGRAPQTGGAVSWDRAVSREHVDVCWKKDRLAVVCLPVAANPIKFKGDVYRDIYAAGGDRQRIVAP
jgi:hypothetical protein